MTSTPKISSLLVFGLLATPLGTWAQSNITGVSSAELLLNGGAGTNTGTLLPSISPGSNDRAAFISSGAPTIQGQTPAPLPGAQARVAVPSTKQSPILNMAEYLLGQPLSEEPRTPFEDFVSKLAGEKVDRITTPAMFSDVLLASITEPPGGYKLQPGDEVVVTLTGSIDSVFTATIDRAGMLNLPKLGPVKMAGVPAEGLKAYLQDKYKKYFNNLEVSASLGQLRGMPVMVTGYARRPGPLLVPPTTTAIGLAMYAGGPQATGSMRKVDVRRGGKLLKAIDLYKVILDGDTSDDIQLQAGDVISFAAAGPQVALIGSVNRPLIAEAKSGETLADLLRFTGGLAPTANRQSVGLLTLGVTRTEGNSMVDLNQAAQTPLQTGQVFRALSAVDLLVPAASVQKRVKIMGEVKQPGELVLAPGASLHQAIQTAGGLTPQAYVFGSQVFRQSALQQQQEARAKRIEELRARAAMEGTTASAISAQDVSEKSVQVNSTLKLIEALSAVKPTGRLVLNIQPNSSALPDLPLEDGDSVYIPAVPGEVNVVGSAFANGSFVFEKGKLLKDYVNMAGGLRTEAKENEIFVLRANGSVQSAVQHGSGWISSGADMVLASQAQPGDTIVVPENLRQSTFTKDLKDWTSILYQFGLGAAAIKLLK